MKNIRLLLADDHPLVRAGIRTTLNAQAGFEMVGETSNGYDTRLLAEELMPDVLLLDLSMPGPPPAETVRYLREHCPKMKILVLTAYDDDVYVRGMVAAGVDGYILKDEAAEAVVRAIKAILHGDTWFSRSILGKMLQQDHQKWNMTEEKVELTHREKQILQLIAKGMDNSKIASQLNLAEQTVRNYVCRLYPKIGVNSRSEAIVWARKQNWLMTADVLA